jgi:hypothetical protein
MAKVKMPPKSRQTKQDVDIIFNQIRNAQNLAKQRGYISSVVEIECGWSLSIWANGLRLALIELAKAGNSVTRYYDKKGATVRVTTDGPVPAVRQCYAL